MWEMIKNEWRFVRKNRLILLSVIVMAFIPLLYSVFFLKSVWDPYGNTQNLPVAVVNKDRPVHYNGATLNVGKQTVTKLKNNNQLGWRFVSAKKAAQGMKDKKYYTVVTLPKNFSKNAATLLDKNPKKMQLTYKTNDSLNYIGEVISQIGATSLDKEIRAAVTNAYASAVFDQLHVVGKGMHTAAGGASQLDTGLVTMNDGLKQYTVAVSQVNDGVQTLNMSVKPLASGAGQLATGSATLAKGLNKYTAGVLQLGTGAGQLNANSSKLTSGATQLAGGTALLNGKTGALTGGVNQLATGSQKFSGGVQAYTAGVGSLSGGLGQLATNSQQLRSGTSELKNSLKDLPAGVTALNDGNTELATQVAQLNQQLATSGLLNLAKNPQQLTTLRQQSSNLEQSLASSQTQDLLNGMNQLAKVNLTGLSDSVAKLQTAATEAQTTMTGSLGQIAANAKESAQDAQAVLVANPDLDQASKAKLTAIIAREAGTSPTSTASELKITQATMTGLAQQLTTAENTLTTLAPTLTKVSSLGQQLPELQEKLQAAKSLLASTNTLMSQLNTKENQTLLAAMPAKLNDLQKATQQLAAGTQQLDTQVNAKVPGSQQSLLLASLNQLETGTTTYTKGVDAANAGATQLKQNSGSLASGATQLAGGIGSMQQQLPPLVTGISTLNGGAQQLSSGVQQYTGGVQALNSGASQLNANSATLNNGAQQLASGLGQLNQQVPQLVTGVGQLASGTGQLNAKSTDLIDGNIKLNTGAAQLATALKSGSKKVNGIKTTPKTTAMFASPTSLKHQNYSYVPNYGHALAPYVLSLALYVGALVFNFAYPIRKISMSGKSATAWFFSKVSLGAAVAVAMAIIEATLIMAFGLQVDHVGAFYLIAIIFALASMFTIMFLSMALDNPGRFLAMILLMLQLGGSGGTFPMEVTNGFFNAIHRFLPMTYSILGFREAITSGLGGRTIGQVTLILATFTLVALILLWAVMVLLQRIHLAGTSQLDENQKLQKIEK
ncbi:YhgE/Pip domain-containing protein [Loigolactobacillus backii]|uniref:YhgE/Pip domain-containing protein n=2 Tax=Loigolactobacillus backii TaxID=375175 RepID=UPI0007F1668B|nr:hypothetical protein AYR52_09835 [Loigolactobacillus backii]ANK65474.1 hypothetical protein AYR54_09635 [Loigolactobacillus backii]ANK67948.1 hypothetical protein AYR55_09765 [Loigolactobacillus backii]